MIVCVFYAATASVIAASRVDGWGRENTTDLRQGKSSSPAVIQALVRACLSPCRPVGTRAASKQTLNDYSATFGTVRRVVLLGSPR